MSTHVKIDPLDSDNYTIWKLRMTDYLTAHGLYEALIEAAPEVAVDKKARAHIGLHVVDHIRMTLEGHKTAKAVWKFLEETYTAKTVARKLQLRRSFAVTSRKARQRRCRST